jgi:hypothetical protein
MLSMNSKKGDMPEVEHRQHGCRRARDGRGEIPLSHVRCAVSGLQCSKDKGKREDSEPINRNSTGRV